VTAAGILVVDDDEAMVRTLCDIFRKRGWNPTAAHSGEQAVASHRERPFSCVLMDIKMPGIDGIAAFRKMREHVPSQRVILMTAHTSPDEMDAAVKAGVWRVFAKPLDLPAMFAALA
jgi:DNA-binding NtrC family response regulator